MVKIVVHDEVAIEGADAREYAGLGTRMYADVMKSSGELFKVLQGHIEAINVFQSKEGMKFFEVSQIGIDCIV